MGSHSTPSPEVGRPVTAGGLAHDSGHRKLLLGHTRISSESNLPNENGPGGSKQRSSSALGTAGGYRRPVQNLRTDHTHKTGNGPPPKRQSLYGTLAFSNIKALPQGQDRPLEPLTEDDVPENGEPPRPGNENAKTDGLLTPTFGTSSDGGLKRSTSSAQMRDLRDQVNDLKGRLSTLRDQARADSLKRRSLQSLRTPSPFTHARVEQWYADANGHEDGVTVSGDIKESATTGDDNNVHDRPGDSGEAREEFLPVQTAHADETTLPASNSADPQPALPTVVDDANMKGTDVEAGSLNELDDIMNELDYLDDVRTEDGYDDPDGSSGSASESGESSYHDSVQAQLSHEDREDAFDYEHFFLHSAMGSMSRRQMRRRGSNDSFTSEDSVETTRGPVASYPPDIVAAKIGRLSRRGSAESISTMDSFATATEGRHTRTGITQFDEDTDEYTGHFNALPERARTHTPETAKRMAFNPDTSDSSSDPSRSRTSLSRRPQSSAAAFQHRPSTSTGTNRSFPLIKNSSPNAQVSTPSSFDNPELRQISETLMSETASILDKERMHDGEKAAAMRMMPKDDQILVERLVASLGRCVLGLTEAGRASAEGRAYRRKIEKAHRILEGYE